MITTHKIIFGNCMSMEELANESVHLIVTSPPYFNAPFDYQGLFKNYEQYLGVYIKYILCSLFFRNFCLDFIFLRIPSLLFTPRDS